VTGQVKQIAAFSHGQLGDLKIDSNFIHEFLQKFINLQLIHEADQCQQDSSTQILLMADD
jgi:hypothetical protein